MERADGTHLMCSPGWPVHPGGNSLVLVLPYILNTENLVSADIYILAVGKPAQSAADNEIAHRKTKAPWSFPGRFTITRFFVTPVVGICFGSPDDCNPGFIEP
jgi:hypothetical protein